MVLRSSFSRRIKLQYLVKTYINDCRAAAGVAMIEFYVIINKFYKLFKSWPRRLRKMECHEFCHQLPLRELDNEGETFYLLPKRKDILQKQTRVEETVHYVRPQYGGHCEFYQCGLHKEATPPLLHMPNPHFWNSWLINVYDSIVGPKSVPTSSYSTSSSALLRA
jgi:hypothetical protein